MFIWADKRYGVRSGSDRVDGARSLPPPAPYRAQIPPKAARPRPYKKV
jgi:hypothetical protein